MKFVRSLRFHDEINSPTSYEFPWHALQIKQFLVESSFFLEIKLFTKLFSQCLYFSMCMCWYRLFYDFLKQLTPREVDKNCGIIKNNNNNSSKPPKNKHSSLWMMVDGQMDVGTDAFGRRLEWIETKTYYTLHYTISMCNWIQLDQLLIRSSFPTAIPQPILPPATARVPGNEKYIKKLKKNLSCKLKRIFLNKSKIISSSIYICSRRADAMPCDGRPFTMNKDFLLGFVRFFFLNVLMFQSYNVIIFVCHLFWFNI